MENDYKKTLLRHLISAATGSAAGRGIQEVISAIKNALSAFKNFSKEWDNLQGGGSSTVKPNEKTGAQQMVKQSMQPMPQMPTRQLQQPQQPMQRMPQQNLTIPPPAQPGQEVRGRGWGEPGNY